MALVFARRVTDPLIHLLQHFDRALVEHKAADLRGWFVLLTPERTVMEQKLDELASRSGLGALPLTLGDIPTGPPNYRFHRDVEVTVLLYRDSKVVVNHSFRRNELTEASVTTVAADLVKIIPAK